jgi:hypothetical protein
VLILLVGTNMLDAVPGKLMKLPLVGVLADFAANFADQTYYCFVVEQAPPTRSHGVVGARGELLSYCNRT